MRLPDLPALVRALGPCLLLCAILAGPLAAGSAPRVELEELVSQCDVGLEGRVQRVRVLESAPKRIETELTFAVTRRFWGEGPAELVVRIPGGVLPDGRGLVLPGLPRFAEGEELILFLSQESRRGTRMPVGLAQGRFRVERRADGTKALVRDQEDLELVDPHTGRATRAAPQARFDYDATVARIQAAAAARRAKPAGGGPK